MTITKIEVYWDAQDHNNEGWAMRWVADGVEASCPIDLAAASPIVDVIAYAIKALDVDLTTEQWTVSYNTDSAVWQDRDVWFTTPEDTTMDRYISKEME